MRCGNDDAALCLDACAAVFESLSCGKSDVPTGVEQGVSGILDRVGTDIELTVCGNDARRLCIEFSAEGIHYMLLCIVGCFRLPNPLLIRIKLLGQVCTSAEDPS